MPRYDRRRDHLRLGPRHNGRLAKVVRIQHGQIVAVEPAPQAGLHRFRSVHVGSLAEVMKAVQDAAERGEIAVRGEPLAHVEASDLPRR